MTTPPISHRAQRTLHKKMQEGTLLSFTTVRHPPAGFPAGPRIIGLIELADGSKVTGCICAPLGSIAIGMRVAPRMRLSRVTAEGLRIYDVAYEIVTQKEALIHFPGYVLALTGPSGVGKTTVSILLSTQVGKYVERVPIVTTREPKAGDEDEYTHVTAEKFMDMKQSGKLAASTIIPSKSEKRWYGYRKQDIESIWKKGKIPIVVTEMHLLQGLSSQYGRRSILSFGLMPPGKSKRQMLSALLFRLRSRGRDTEVQIRDRLKNAESDLKFFRDRKELFDELIVNDNVESVVGQLHGLVLERVQA